MSDARTVWELLAAPLPPETIRQRDDKGTPIRYIDARTVIERLNEVCPGEWHFETDLLHVPSGEKGDKWVFKGRLTVCGVTQEDVGMNDNEQYFDPPKSAVSDALKRCAVHFGIGIELYPGGGREGYSKPKPAQKPQNAPSASPAPQDVSSQGESGGRPYAPSQLKAWFDLLDKSVPVQSGTREAGSITDAAGLHRLFSKTGLSNDDAYAFAFYMFGVDGFGNLSAAQERIMGLWLKDVKSARIEAQDCIKVGAMDAPNQE